MLPPYDHIVNMADALDEHAQLSAPLLSGADSNELLEAKAAQMLRDIAAHIKHEAGMRAEREQYLNSVGDYEDSMRGDYD